MKVVAFKIQIDGKEEIVDVTKSFAVLNNQLLLVNKTLIQLDKNTGDTVKKFSEVQKSIRNNTKAFSENNKTIINLGNGYIEVQEEVKEVGKAITNTRKKVKDLSDEELKQLELQKLINRERRKIAKQTATLERADTKSLNAKKAQLESLILDYNKLDSTSGEALDKAKEIRRTRAELKKLQDRTKETTSFTTRLGKSLTRALIGRDIFRAAITGIGNIISGLGDIVEQGAKTNETFRGIQDSLKGLRSTARAAGTSFLNSFGSAIQKTIENVSFVIFQVRNALSSAAESSGFLGDSLRFVGNLVSSIFTDFPAIIGGVSNAISSFADIARDRFNSFALSAQRAFLELRIAVSSVTGENLAELESNLAQVNNELKEIQENATTFSSAYVEGFEATKKAQEEFNESLAEQVKEEEKRAKAIENATKARAAAVEEAKKAAQELEAERKKIREALATDQQARLALITNFSKQLAEAEIQNIQDAEARARTAEINRFNQEKQALEQQVKDLEDINAERIARATELLSPAELKPFVDAANAELQQARDNANRIAEEKQEQHQANLLKIQEEGEEARKDEQLKNLEELNRQLDVELQKQLLIIDQNLAEGTLSQENAQQDRLAIQKQGLEARLNLLQSQNLANLEKEQADQIILERQRLQTELAKINEQIAEDTKKSIIPEDINESIQQVGQITGQILGQIDGLIQASFDAQQRVLDEEAANRQRRIDGLNEELEDATGLQKKFLEQQVKDEERAAEEIAKEKEKLAKQAGETQKAFAITQAIINTALAVTNALATAPNIIAGIALAAVAAASGAIEIATISSQQFAKGGIIDGPSHAGGGVPVMGGRAEVEGGEGIINKNSMRNPILRKIASLVNVAGGGDDFANAKSDSFFQTGGIMGAPMQTPNVRTAQQVESQSNNRLEQIVAQQAEFNAELINKVNQVVPVLAIPTLQDQVNTENTLDVQTTI